MFISKLIPLKEALSKVEENISLMDTEVIDLKDSCGRVLSKGIKSYHNSPPFDKSAMDGYALIAEDTFGASNSVIKDLKIIDRIGAGDFSDKTVVKFTHKSLLGKTYLQQPRILQKEMKYYLEIH